MTEFIRSELKLLSQIFLGALLTTIYGLVCSFSGTQFPILSYIGAPIGMAIILLCWIGKKTSFFIGAMIASTVVFSLYFNWTSLFQTL